MLSINCKNSGWVMYFIVSLSYYEAIKADYELNQSLNFLIAEFSGPRSILPQGMHFHRNKKTNQPL